MATYTASAYDKTPKQLHAGLQGRNFSITQLISNSVGSVVLLCKIPNQAVVTDCWGRYQGQGSTGGGEFSISIMKASTASASVTLGVLVDSFSATTGSGLFHMRKSTMEPFRVSLSDQAPITYANLILRVATGMTATDTIQLNGVVYWAMDA